MKRPLGLIGITYLSVLAVVFYFYNSVIIIAVLCLSALSVIVAFVLKLRSYNKAICNSLIAVGITSLCAIAAITLYTNFVYNPIIQEYSDKEIKISGYVCDEVQKREKSCTYTVHADEINGEKANVKINFISYSYLDISEFDRITATVTLQANDTSYLLSKGIYFSAYEDSFEISSTGEKQFSLYGYAVNARKALNNSLDSLMSESPSSLCKAVLLGEKQALSYDVKDIFSKTGTSFLIVVSGMHLAIAVGLILFLIKKITNNQIVHCVAVLLIVTAYSAVTGFTPSIVRSGIMVGLTYLAPVFFSQSDSLNSLGIAAILLTAFNPYSVGDIGMLLSFSATLGIILWAKRIYVYIITKFKLKQRILKTSVKAIAVSLSATLWVIPITVIAFGTISPLTVFIAFICEPLVSLILDFALIASVLYICPIISFLAYPFGLAAGIVSKFVIQIMKLFAKVPFCTVQADKIYFYVWLAVSVVLVIVGYLIKVKIFYIRTSVALSAVTLVLGWALYSIVDYNSVTLNVYYSQGVTAVVRNGNNATILSCGGTNKYRYAVTQSLSTDLSSVDNIIIPNQKNKYSKYLPSLLDEFDVSNVLVYDKNSENQEMLENYDGFRRSVFGDNVSFSLRLNSNTNDTIYAFDGITVQYIVTNNSSILFLPSGADVSKLPENILSVDYILTDGVSENSDLLNCQSIIFAGKEEDFEKSEYELSLISENIITAFDDKTEIKL
ncbi:MAG: ComEC family competence protein [Ruminococcus bromii]|nr:ComEC family competence protein [Ruminococcus bromii]